MFVEKKYETLIDLRFPVSQWPLFKAITNGVDRVQSQEAPGFTGAQPNAKTGIKVWANIHNF